MLLSFGPMWVKSSLPMVRDTKAFELSVNKRYGFRLNIKVLWLYVEIEKYEVTLGLWGRG